MIPSVDEWLGNIGRSCVRTVALAVRPYRGPFADRRPDELAIRLAAQRDRELGYEQACRDDETRRVKRGETPAPGRCEQKAAKHDGA